MAVHVSNHPCQQPSSSGEPERGDLILYKVAVLREALRPEHALDFLEENAALIPDRLTYLETRASLLLELSRVAEARKAYTFLLKRNVDNVDYMKKVEECIQLRKFFMVSFLNNVVSSTLFIPVYKGPDVNQQVLAFYDEFIEANPRTRILQIRRLLHTQNDAEFQANFIKFLVNGLRSGLPSLFTCLEVFYKDSKKVISFCVIHVNEVFR